MSVVEYQDVKDSKLFKITMSFLANFKFRQYFDPHPKKIPKQFYNNYAQAYS